MPWRRRPTAAVPVVPVVPVLAEIGRPGDDMREGHGPEEDPIRAFEHVPQEAAPLPHQFSPAKHPIAPMVYLVAHAMSALHDCVIA